MQLLDIYIKFKQAPDLEYLGGYHDVTMYTKDLHITFDGPDVFFKGLGVSTRVNRSSIGTMEVGFIE